MTKPDLWRLLVQRNPRFITGPIAFSPETLRRFFDLVWDEAKKDKSFDAGDIFQGLFGGIRR